MSRHRNVRSMNYSDEYDGFDDVYGHSVEDDYTISPSDAAFMYDRNRRQPQMSSYLKGEEDIAEEDEQSCKDNSSEKQNNADQQKLTICLDEVKNVLGDSFSDQIIINCILEKQYDTAAVVDSLLNKGTLSKKETADAPKPQRLTSLRSSERGGSRNVRRNLGNHPKTRMPQGVIATDIISGNVDFNISLMEKYKKYEIDFSEVLIKFTTKTLDNQINSNNTSSVPNNNKPQDASNNVKFYEIKNKHSFIKIRHPLYSSNLSKIGYYLCTKYNELPTKLKLCIEPQTNITPFNFDTRSPDEMIKKSCVVVKKVERKFKF